MCGDPTLLIICLLSDDLTTNVIYFQPAGGSIVLLNITTVFYLNLPCACFLGPHRFFWMVDSVSGRLGCIVFTPLVPRASLSTKWLWRNFPLPSAHHVQSDEDVRDMLFKRAGFRLLWREVDGEVGELTRPLVHIAVRYPELFLLID